MAVIRGAAVAICVAATNNIFNVHVCRPCRKSNQTGARVIRGTLVWLYGLRAYYCGFKHSAAPFGKRKQCDSNPIDSIRRLSTSAAAWFATESSSNSGNRMKARNIANCYGKRTKWRIITASAATSSDDDEIIIIN